TYDGREKSLLRGAARDVLPESVVQRVKSPYPSTSDPKYVGALQGQVKDLLTTPNDALFGVIDRAVLDALTSLEPELIEQRDRAKMERALDLSVWIDLYRPQIIV